MTRITAVPHRGQRSGSSRSIAARSRWCSSDVKRLVTIDSIAPE